MSIIVLSFVAAELIFAILWFGTRILLAAFRRKVNLRREALMFLMYVNLAVILRIVYFKMESLAGLPIGLSPYNVRLNLVPFVNICDYPRLLLVILNIAGNIIMFMPTGILLPILYKKLDSFPKTLMAGFLFSLLIELSQLLMPRVTDIDDLILNTTGVALGYGVYALAKKLIRRRGKV